MGTGRRMSRPLAELLLERLDRLEQLVAWSCHWQSSFYCYEDAYPVCPAPGTWQQEQAANICGDATGVGVRMSPDPSNAEVVAVADGIAATNVNGYVTGVSVSTSPDCSSADVVAGELPVEPSTVAAAEAPAKMPPSAAGVEPAAAADLAQHTREPDQEGSFTQEQVRGVIDTLIDTVTAHSAKVFDDAMERIERIESALHARGSALHARETVDHVSRPEAGAAAAPAERTAGAAAPSSCPPAATPAKDATAGGVDKEKEAEAAAAELLAEEEEEKGKAKAATDGGDATAKRNKKKGKK